MTAAQAKLADARFAAYGDTLYPDATFTLRISYGKVHRLDRARAGRCRPSPMLGGTYDRATGADPVRPAAAFVTAREQDRPEDRL